MWLNSVIIACACWLQYMYSRVFCYFSYVLISTTYDHVRIFITFRSFLHAVPMCTYFCQVCIFYMKNSAFVSCFKHNCLFDDFSKECFPKCPISPPPPQLYVSSMLKYFCQLLRLNHRNQDKTCSTAEDVNDTVWDSGPPKWLFSLSHSHCQIFLISAAVFWLRFQQHFFFGGWGGGGGMVAASST